MSGRFDALLQFARRALIDPLGRLGARLPAIARASGTAACRARGRLALAALLTLGVAGFYTHPPFATAGRGELLVRTNLFDGSASAWSSGTVLAVPGIHQVRRYSIRDQVYRPVESASATGTAPFQSIEGLSIGVDLAVRWAIDRARIAQMSKDYPDDLTADLVQPAVQGVVYRLFSRYSVREIFSSKRSEIQQQLAAELTPKLAAVGLRLRGVDMGKVDLPPDYRAGMEKLLAEELETEKVRYTLELKAAQVKETQLEAEAAKVRRQKAAEAGFTPHTRRLLIVREAREHGRFRRRFEELRLDDLALVRQAGNPEVLPDFGRWQDVTWRRDTLALR